VIALVGIGLAIAFAIAVQFDPSNLTMSNPPVYSGAVLVAGAVAFGCCQYSKWSGLYSAAGGLGVSFVKYETLFERWESYQRGVVLLI